MRPIQAEPIHSPGDTVLYFDRHKRVQRGEIVRLEAHWSDGKSAPLIVYSIRHPTYSGLAHVTEEDLNP